jgi:hypothetical protein
MKSMQIRFPAVLTMVLIVAASRSLRADVKPAPVFANHMVLQRDMPAPLNTAQFWSNFFHD